MIPAAAPILARLTTAMAGYSREAAASSRMMEGAVRTAAGGMTSALKRVDWTSMAKGAVQAALDVRRFEQALAITTGSTRQAAREIEFISGLADRLGVKFDDLIEPYVRLAAATRDTALAGEQTRIMFETLAKATIAAGASTEDQKAAFAGLSAMLGSGVVDARTFRDEIGTALPNANAAAARSLGVTSDEFKRLLDAGKLSSDFLQRFIQQVGSELPANLEHSAAPFNRLHNDLQAVGRTLADAVMDDLAVAAGNLSSVLKQMEADGSLEALGSFLSRIVSWGGKAIVILGKVAGGLRTGSLTSVPQALRGTFNHTPQQALQTEIEEQREALNAAKRRAAIANSRHRRATRAPDTAEVVLLRERLELLLEIQRRGGHFTRRSGGGKINIAVPARKPQSGAASASTSPPPPPPSVAARPRVGRPVVATAHAAPPPATRDDSEEAQRARDEFDIAVGKIANERDLLNAGAALVLEAEDRLKIERRLLDLRQQEERLQLAAVRDDSNRSAGERQAAIDRLATLDDLYAKRAAALAQTEEPPVPPGSAPAGVKKSALAAYADEVRASGAEMNAALEQIAMNGVRRLDDSLTGTIANVFKLGGAFGQIANQVIADLIRIQVQRNITGPLADLFLGGSGAGLFGGLFGAPKNAVGGSYIAGTAKGNDRGIAMLRVNHGERIDVTPANRRVAGRGGGTTVIQPLNVSFAGAITTPELMAQFKAYADGVGQAAVIGGAAMAQSRMVKRASRALPR